MNLDLTREIIRHIFLLLGLGANNIGIGLLHPALRMPQDIFLEYEDKEVLGHPVFAGEITLDSAMLKALVVDLSLENQIERLLLIQYQEKPIYILQMNLSESDPGKFQIYSQNKFLTPNIIMQAQFLIGIEKIIDLGYVWQNINDSSLEEFLSVIGKICEEN